EPSLILLPSASRIRLYKERRAGSPRLCMATTALAVLAPASQVPHERPIDQLRDCRGADGDVANRSALQCARILGSVLDGPGGLARRGVRVVAAALVTSHGLVASRT